MSEIYIFMIRRDDTEFKADVLRASTGDESTTHAIAVTHGPLPSIRASLLCEKP